VKAWWPEVTCGDKVQAPNACPSSLPWVPLETDLDCFPAGNGDPRENSPFINNVEVEKESYFEGKNMALFEVILFSPGK
jgi:hypothetical protein